MRALFLTFAVLCAGGFVACATVERKEGPEIADFDIEGTHALKEGDIKTRLLTEQSGRIPILTRKQHFDPNVWRTDLKRIERYYQERGYYQAQVVQAEVEPETDAPNSPVRLKIRVDEGPPTMVANVEVQLASPLPPDHQGVVTGLVASRKGLVFEEEWWEGQKGLMRGMLRGLGYAEAKVDGHATVRTDTHEASLLFTVDPGQRYQLGEIHVRQKEGAKVAAWRVEEQVRNALEDELWFSDAALEEAQARVYRMGVFGAVRVRAGKGDPETGKIPVEVIVQEAPFHEVRAGGGIGLEPTRNDAHLIGEYTDRDFFGGTRRLNLAARLGWAFLPNAYTLISGRDDVVTKNGAIGKITSDFDQPRLFHPNFTWTSRVELERGLEPAYSFYGARGKTGVAWGPCTWLSFLLSYNIEVYRLDAGEAQLGLTTPTLLFGCPGVCSLSYLEQTAAIDKRDNKVEPKRGYYLGLSVQEGGGLLGGSFQYVRVLPEARGYYSVGPAKELTFSARIRLGTLLPANGDPLSSPIVARFFSGGGNDMRGFGTRRLSPMYIVPLPEPTPEGYTGEPFPIGGNGLFESALEARYDVWGPLTLAVFTEAGFVTSESLPLADLGGFTRNTLFAVGGGVRVRTPVGPIRLDFAYRPNVGPPLQVYASDATLTYSNNGGGCFGLGGGSGTIAGSPEGPCSLHLSIGEAF